MGYQLREGVHWCDCDGRAIFLDVNADRYFCLPSAANEAFIRLAQEQHRPEDGAALKMLGSRGVLVESSGIDALRAPPSIDAPTHDLALEPGDPASLALMVKALVTEAVASRLLRTHSFADTLATIQASAGKDKLSWGSERKAARSIAKAEQAIAFVSTLRDRCLVRALSVRWLCAKRGISSKLVFGVIAHPFSAHCWVQTGGAVLVGDYEQARLYTPILVLE